ncbi:MAG: DUF1772 domain-containing protein [Streptomyces sp.]|uniref:DUF1772 domain-containing protein n=1 Tax=Streptomyces sp. TaxID=1931 RepID=UPI0025D4F70C|nr:DUF1772 domain-containing protein [Streptomyces sp.]MBW8798519.1 DUF1772 domain-containing protein [Streptomyces sp.]
MTLLSQLAALLAIMSTGVVYGTDVFCALVQRSALARVDDTALTAVMGNVHRFADRRMQAPGILGILAAAAASVLAAAPVLAAASVLAAAAGHPARSATAGAAFLLPAVWVLLHLRISAPVNRELTAAADAHQTPANARALQRDWDRVIVPRAVLQGLAVLAPGTPLIG